MSALLVMCSLGLLFAAAQKTFLWSRDRNSSGEKWRHQLAALQRARTHLAAGNSRPPEVPEDVLPRRVCQVLIRRGSPLDGTLSAAENSVRTRLHADAQVRGVLAGVRATALILATLPAFGMVLGYLLGARPLRFLTHGWGSVVLLIGVGCQCAGLWWIRHMVEELPSALDPSVENLPILAALLRAGMHIEDASALLPLPRPYPAPWQALFHFATRQGAPIAHQLEALARDSNQAALAACEEAAEEMGVMLARPLGLCFLPAFMLLGVLPTVAELGGAYFHHF